MIGRARSLRVRLAATCAGLAVGLSAALAGIVGQRAQARVEAEVGHTMTMMAEQMADKLDRSMWSRAGEIATLAELVPLRAAGDPAALRRVVDHFKNRFPTVSWMGITDPDGTVLAATDGILEGADISHRPVYRNGRDGLAVGDVHDAVLLASLLPNPSGEPMKFVDISAPILGDDGRLLGVLATHFSWQWVREIERSIVQPMHDREAVQVYVVAADGTVLLGPKPAMGRPLGLASVAAAQAGGTGWAVEVWPDGQPYVTGYDFGGGHLDYKGLGWSVLVRKPLAVAYASADALRDEILLWGGGFAVVFSVVGWIAAVRLTRPLAQLSEAAARLRRGEPGAAIPTVRATTEVETLADSMRTLVEGLTRSRSALSSMEDIAYQDRLTTLPNRRFFETHVQTLAARVVAGGGSMAILFIDLDGFKPVNDQLGHAAGDAVLRQSALRMASCLRNDDLIARLGGDEFVTVLASDGSESGHGHGEAPDGGSHPLAVAGRLIAAVGEPLIVDGVSVRIGCSIGIASFPDDGGTVESVMERADAALYAAKRAGKNRAVEHGAASHADAAQAGPFHG